MARPKTFDVPAFEETCYVCGVQCATKYATQVSGKTVCIKCNRYRHVVHALRLVEYLAETPCYNVLCDCPHCNARKVQAFITKWHSAKHP